MNVEPQENLASSQQTRLFPALQGFGVNAGALVAFATFIPFDAIADPNAGFELSGAEVGSLTLELEGVFTVPVIGGAVRAPALVVWAVAVVELGAVFAKALRCHLGDFDQCLHVGPSFWLVRPGFLLS